MRNSEEKAVVAAIEIEAVDIGALQKKVVVLEDLVKTLAEAAGGNLKMIDDLRRELDDSKKAFKGLSDSVNDANTGLAAVNKVAAGVQTAISDPKTGLAAVNALAESTQTTVDDPKTGLAAVNTLAANMQTAISDPKTGLAALNAALAKVEAKEFPHEQAQHHYFNLTVPRLPNSAAKTVKVAMLGANNHPIVTFQAEQGATLSIEGTPGQKATFQMIVGDTVVDTVTLTA